MLEVLQFIFSSFWIWLGTAMLLSIPFIGIRKIIKTKMKCAQKTLQNN